MITDKARARLKVLDNNGIEAGLLREFLIKELHTASLTAIRDKLDALATQMGALTVLYTEIEIESQDIQPTS